MTAGYGVAQGMQAPTTGLCSLVSHGNTNDPHDLNMI
jgi:hypothetical protein